MMMIVLEVKKARSRSLGLGLAGLVDGYCLFANFTVLLSCILGLLGVDKVSYE